VNDDFFAPPPFKAEDALARLKRELREMGLAERTGVFERGGVAIARAVAQGATIQAAIVRRPSRNSPEWSPRTLRSSAEVREFAADLKRKLSAWSDRDE
jgi:hypothetical protein